MPNQKELLIKIKEEVSKALTLLQGKNPGANVEEAKKLLNETVVALQKDDLDTALSLSQKAQLAARPNTEYLLNRAKGLESQGSEAYSKQDFLAAVKFWQDSLKEYNKVLELAGQRGEQEIVDRIATTMSAIEGNIKKANLSKANFEMRNYVSQANRFAGEAKSQYENGMFNEACAKFKTAHDNYSSALTIAKENKLTEEDKLNKAAADMQTSIQACLFGQAEKMLEKSGGDKGERKEQACSEVLKYLETFSSSDSEHNELKKKANAGIAQARIEVGSNLIDEAKALYNKRDYYNAKERFRKAQDHFNKVSDFTVTQRLETEKAQIDSLIDTCTSSIKACTNNLIGAISEIVDTLPADPITYVGGVGRNPVKIEASDRDRMDRFQSELSEEYGAIKWLKPGGVNYIGLAQNREGKQVILRLPKKLDASRKRSFLQEWREWEDLKQHRNIVTLIEANISPPLLVLEYVDGGSLSDYLRQTRVVDIKVACHIINDVARGLEYAHSKCTIHADLKPSNILLTKIGEAKITDWSLGKSYTPGYAAPEQFDRKEATEKTDVYQIGLIFYEMLCGDNPFDHGSVVDKENKAKTWNPEKLSSRSSRLELLDEITLGCLAKEPGQRPSVKEFRKSIYIYLKEHHGESLSISTDIKTQISELSNLAILAAKQNEPKDLQDTLKSILLKMAEEPRKKLIQETMPKMGYINIIYNTYNAHDSVIQVKSNPTYPQQDGIVNETEILVREALVRSL